MEEENNNDYDENININLMNNINKAVMGNKV